MDPHGAVAYLGLQDYRKTSDDCVGVFLETAHPAKFSEVVAQATGVMPPMPDRLSAYIGRSKKSLVMENDYSKLKEWMTESTQS